MGSSILSQLGFVRERLTRRNVGELAWVLGGQVVTLLMGLVTVKVLTRMGTSAYGEYTLTLTVSALLGQLLYGPAQQGFVRFYFHYEHLGRASSFVRLMYEFLASSGGAIAAIAVIGSAVAWALGRPSLAVLCLAGGFLVVAQKADDFFNSALNVLRKRRENYVLQAAQRAVATGVLAALLFAGRLALVPAIVAIAVVTTFAVAAKHLTYRRHVPADAPATGAAVAPEPARATYRQVGRYVLPFMIWGLAGWLQLNGEKWILAQHLSAADVGAYAVLLGVANLLLNVPNGMMMELVTPIIFKHFADPTNGSEHAKGLQYIRLTVACMAALTVFAAVAMHWLGRVAILLVSDASYAQHAAMLPVLSVGIGLFLVGQAMCTLGMALNEPAAYLPPKLVVGVLSVGVNAVCIVKWGVTGIGYASVVVGAAYAAYVALVNRRIHRQLRGPRRPVVVASSEAA